MSERSVGLRDGFSSPLNRNGPLCGPFNSVHVLSKETLPSAGRPADQFVRRVCGARERTRHFFCPTFLSVKKSWGITGSGACGRGNDDEREPFYR